MEDGIENSNGDEHLGEDSASDALSWQHLRDEEDLRALLREALGDGTAEPQGDIDAMLDAINVPPMSDERLNALLADRDERAAMRQEWGEDEEKPPEE